MPAAGDKVRASDIATAAGVFVRKSLAETVTSSTTLQNDDHLKLDVLVNSFYIVRGLILYDGATTGDIKFAWTGPAGFTFRYGHNAPATSIAGATGNTVDNREIKETDTLGAGCAGAGTTIAMQLLGILTTIGTAGTFQLQWAQFASDATATRVFAGSFLHAQKIQ